MVGGKVALPARWVMGGALQRDSEFFRIISPEGRRGAAEASLWQTGSLNRKS